MDRKANLNIDFECFQTGRKAFDSDAFPTTAYLPALDPLALSCHPHSP